MKLKLPTAHCLLLTAHCLLAAAARAELNKDILLNEAELIKVIQKADTSDNDVVTACQNLGWCGTKAAVAPLAALLASDKPHLRHAARYGLEMIPDPAAVDALCDAAGRLSGPALAGVLQSLGNRGNARAVDLLAKRAADPDKAVAAAAVQALGKLATPAAMAALKAALGTCPCVAEAYLDGAGRLAAADPAKAAACYADLRNTRANVAPAVRLAALLGEAVTAGDAGLELWEKAVADADADTVEAALRAVLDAQPGNRETLAFAKALAAVPAAQARLATLLGQRGDKAAVPALAALAARYAGHAEEPAFTVTSAVYGDPDGKQAKDITAQLQALVDNGAAAIKAGNHIAGDPAPNVPKVLRLVYTAGGVEKRVTLAENQTLAIPPTPPSLAANSLAAAAALAALNDPAALPPLLALSKNRRAAIADAAKNEIAGFAGKAADDAVLTMMADANTGTRLAGIDMALRRRMAVAIPALAKLTTDADAKVTDAAVKGLGDLGTAAEIPALIAVIKKNPASETAVRALSSVCSRYARPRAGNVVVKSAHYGSFEHNLVKDVTGNVQALVDAGSITIQSTGRLCKRDGFSEDPAPGKAKALRMVYTFDGVEKSAAVAENDAFHLSGVTLLPEALNPTASAYQAASGEEKIALFKVLAALGNDQALAIARAAAKQTADPALQEAAIRALIDWKTPDALADTAAFAQSAPSNRLKILALRGFIRQLEQAFTISNADKLPRLQAARAWAVRDEDKALVDAAFKAVGGQLAEEGFTPIFDGKSLAGWKGGGGLFEVKDGILQGQTFEGKTPKQTTHLIWTGGQPADFDLRLEFKLSPQANSGIQVRSKDQEFGDNAYQADMNGGGNYVGFLYHPRQHLVGERGKKVVFKPEDEAKKPSHVEELPEFKGMNQKQIQDKIFMADVWNELRIVAKGQTVTLFVNGMKAQETTDPRPDFLPAKGFITLQVHPGPPMKAQFRNLRIKEL